MENDREHNHSAEWIKWEEPKYAHTECQPWEDISQDELQTVLKKASNWKSPVPDAVPNFWLKQLTALHQLLLNAYNQAIERAENLPDWFTTAQTYLLPKNKDTENPKNYRPIAFLSTSYKVLTSILKGLVHDNTHARRLSLQNKFVGSTINSKSPLPVQSLKILRFIRTSVALAGLVILR